MKRLQLETKWIFTLAASLMLMTTVALAGDLDAPAPPSDPGSAMFTLEDLYNRLSYGTAGAKRSGAFTGPVATPGSTMRTLDQIMAKAPALNGSAATAAEVVTGKTYWGLSSGSNWGVRTGTMANVGAQHITPGTTSQTITQGFHSGTGTVAGAADLTAENIKSGATIFGVSGDANVVNTSSGTATAGSLLSGAKAWVAGAEVTGTMPDNGAQNITPSTISQTISPGYHSGTGAVAGDANLTAGNIKAGATIFGVTGASAVVDTSTGNALESEIASGKLAWVNGVLVSGKLAGGTYVSSTTGTWSAGGRWVNRGDGTVVDTFSGLIWDQSGTQYNGTFYEMLDHCNDHWRMPTLGELESAVSMWQSPEWVTTSLIGQGIIANVTTNWVWTSTSSSSGVYMCVKLDTHDDGGIYPNLNNNLPFSADVTGIYLWRVRSAW